jgi:hypothetical protein
VDPVGVRIQNLPLGDQVLTLARIAEARSESGRFAPADVDALFDEFSLPRPAKVANQMGVLDKRGFLKRAKVSGKAPAWQVTPLGRATAIELADDMDLAALAAEAARRGVTVLADTPHPVIPPSLAPPELIGPLRDFFADHPFAQNVFGMTRFPGTPEDGELDPIAPALEVAREVCKAHGLQFHLASDRQIVDDLWANVAAHIWGSQYAIAFYEDRTGKGLNYNLNIEVGSTLVLGRRLAILKDKPVERLPTDLVGRIFKEVDLDALATVAEALHRWCRDDLRLGACADCPKD